MIYFESIKLHNVPISFTNGLNLTLQDNQVHFLYSKNERVIQTFYQFLKSKNGYLGGNLFVDKIDLTELDSNNFTNFCYQNFVFVDHGLIYNPNLKVKNYLKIAYSFHKTSKTQIEQWCKLFHINESILNMRFISLSKIYKFKVLLIMGLILNRKYIIVNYLHFQSLSEESQNEIIYLLNKISLSYKKMIIILHSNKEFASESNVNLDNESYYIYNTKLTIPKKSQNYSGYNLLVGRFNIIWYAIKHSLKINLWYYFIAIIAMLISVLFLGVLSYKNVDQSFPIWIQYVNNHRAGFYALSVISVIIGVIGLIIASWLIYKRMKRYIIFLHTISIHNLLVSIIVPVLLMINIFILVTISYLIAIFILISQNISYNVRNWNYSLYATLVYIICTFIISYYLIYTTNKANKFKK